MSDFRETTSLDGPPISADVTVGVNLGHAAPITAEDSFARVAGALDRIFSYDFHFKKKGQSESDPTRYKIVATNVICEGTGQHTGLAVDRGIPGQVLDPLTKKMVDSWTRKTEQTQNGENIFSDFQIAGWKFLEDYEVDLSTNRCTKSEEEELLSDLAPVLKQFKAFSEQGEKDRAEQAEKIRQAAASKMNPTGSLAAGIAAGVAEALRELGITPKKKSA